MKNTSFGFLPNKVVMSRKPIDIYPNISDSDKLNNVNTNEYSYKMVPHAYKRTISSFPMFDDNNLVYNPNIVNIKQMRPPHNNSNFHYPLVYGQKKNNCLNSCSCMKKSNSNICNKINDEHNKNNEQKHINDFIPILFNNKKILVSNVFDNAHNKDPVSNLEASNSNYNFKHNLFTHPGGYVSIDHKNRSRSSNDSAPHDNKNNNNDGKNNYGNIMYGKGGNIINPPNIGIFKKKIIKDKAHEPPKSPQINDLINQKDLEIKDLEIKIEKEKLEHEIKDTVLDNNKLKEKLLDQKIKYEETLKHLKKVESEKRTLKSNLNVRDKVLEKLEKEIGSVDNENELLLKIKENSNLSDIHKVFKLLHDKENGEKNHNIKSISYADDTTKNIINDMENDRNSKKNESSKGDKKMEEFRWYKTISTFDGADTENYDIDMNDKKEEINEKNDPIKNDTNFLKATIIKMDKEIHKLKEENKNVNFKYQNTFEALTELRKDTLEYMESIVSRDMRIGYMESMLQKCEKDLEKLKDNFKKEETNNREKIAKLKSEIKILENQSSHLRHMIQEKDSEIVLLKNEIVRNDILLKQYEERNKELQSELRLMCNNLENVIDASNKKDIFMDQLERQIRENEIHRQNAYLKEVAKNRKIHANMKFKEILFDKSTKTQVDEFRNLKKELYLNKIQIEKAKEAFGMLKISSNRESMPRKKKVVKKKNTRSLSENSSGKYTENSSGKYTEGSTENITENCHENGTENNPSDYKINSTKKNNKNDKLGLKTPTDSVSNHKLSNSVAKKNTKKMTKKLINVEEETLV
ncbi:hypothetical protein YYC_01332 [Plasmodium yoelii 17X]|uniref:Protein AAP4 n=3 Tax=Plasmodium yoelii TaxID=5861 RepID=A0AAF0B7C6_PLAYO|nr:conserved protein, unknown function [Plasmodium yoelii]ETB61435.1 hypothetical protein YYC_01332 [Plasmodium yoelii 17X]WBY60766.1 protein AAP4 [Plasmodium yoelii yoelii]CDU20542.1 conserved Plasmodium protein, unknown function [Plasmodium yoelii]VTZ81503.1 conserved protein, unknown function [Plasmodium yoelii]|eukprot:XP_729580.2 conserved protein, unknown function [Plasmodium yoelii]